MLTSSKGIARAAAFQREQCRRIAAHLEQNIEKFERLAAGLDSEICAEEERTQNFVPTHVGYSMVAKSARVRRENLQRSCEDLRLHLESSHAALDENHLEQLPAA
jgi:hypothetical protein